MTNSGVMAGAPLDRLAAAHGVLTGYRDNTGAQVAVPARSVVAALRLLGADLPGQSGRVPAEETLLRALDEEVENRWRLVLEPVIVAWDGALPSFEVRQSLDGGESHGGGSAAKVTFVLSDGTSVSRQVDLAALPVRNSTAVKGRLYEARQVRVRVGRLPMGYHRLEVELGGLTAVATVISAPKRCWRPEGGGCSVRWGVFAPTYSLRSHRDWGAGDLADLRELARWAKSRGGSCASTLPLLATFLDTPFEPSPYRPVSRLFWNEFYLAPDMLPEWGRCEAVRTAWSRVEGRVKSLRGRAEVDYREVMAAKREVLSALAGCFLESEDVDKKSAFKSFLEHNPEALAYARFRARVEATGKDWRSWDEEAAARPESDEAVDYHLYVQWRMEQQLAALADSIDSASLFLDLPVGVHPGGYDTWSRRDLFVDGASLGAPPDDFFALGQQWDSPPMHPGVSRASGHEYFAAMLRRQMRHASHLRIDHVMALHRLYWIPEGMPATEGVYVSYPAEELYAVVCLESHLNKTEVVGEDLGTVPPGVRRTMNRHGVMRSWVLELAARPRGAEPVAAIPVGAVAGIDSHDTYPLAGFMSGDDITARAEAGLLTEGAARREAAARRRWATMLHGWATRDGEPTGGELPPLLGGILGRMLGSSASLVLVSLDDLLAETRPHNKPGTGSSGSNWRLKARAGLEELARVALSARESDRD